MTKNYDESVEIKYKPNSPYIPDYHYRIVIIGDPGLHKTSVL